MGQDLEINFKTTSDVPEATDKAKSSVVSMAKQVEDVQKKFSTAFKDLFLGFFAPMVLFNQVLNMISGAIDRQRQKIEDAKALAEKGESQFISPETSVWAQSVAKQRTEKREKELAKVTDEALAKEELALGKTWGGTADSVIAELWKRGQWIKAAGMYTGINDMASDKDVQDILRSRATGGAMANLPDKGGEYKKLEGFGNVVGVGPNPVFETMSKQLEQQQRQTQLLEEIARRSPPATDFTKPEEGTNFRATPYGL